MELAGIGDATKYSGICMFVVRSTCSNSNGSSCNRQTQNPEKMWRAVHEIKSNLAAKRRARKKLFASEAHPPVIILQMGKVASQTIWKSLETQYSGLVVHSHNFQPNKGGLIMGSKWAAYNEVHRYYHSSAFKRLRIITLVREPVGRNVSAFFQNFMRDTGMDLRSQDFSADQLKHLFIEKYNHDKPLLFFDEINTHFGIDVYDQPFAAEGFMLFSNLKGVEMLVMKHDLPDSEKEMAISSFLCIRDFKLMTYNISDNKYYADFYKRFREQVKLPDWYLIKMKESRYFRHFYSKEVIDSVCEQWAETTSAALDSE